MVDECPESHIKSKAGSVEVLPKTEEVYVVLAMLASGQVADLSMFRKPKATTQHVTKLINDFKGESGEKIEIIPNPSFGGIYGGESSDGYRIMVMLRPLG